MSFAFLRLDRYAAWWPFVGIVIVVLICVIVILAVEKRRKVAQKAAAVATDKTSEPFVFDRKENNSV